MTNVDLIECAQCGTPMLINLDFFEDMKEECDECGYENSIVRYGGARAV